MLASAHSIETRRHHLFRAIDLDGNGIVSFAEFVRANLYDDQEFGKASCCEPRGS